MTETPPTVDRAAAPPTIGAAPSAGVWPWIRVILGAIAFAVLLRALAFEAYRIPSTSMEDTLLVGDFVLVSKLHYGPRVLGRRLPGVDDVGRGDVVVFHYPPGLEASLDQRAPYIKRVVGLPGDSVAIWDKAVRVGGEAVPLPDRARQFWEVRRDGPLSLDTLQAIGLEGRVQRVARGTWLAEATAAEADRLRDLDTVQDVAPYVRPSGDGSAAFPAAFRFSLDNYGPVPVPQAGATVALNDLTWPIVRGVIERFEGHRLERTAGGFLLDGRPADTYTFAQDYFFVLGDNRDDSADSRTWGFVPRDHLIGKAVTVYFSWDDGATHWWERPRWRRIGAGLN